MFAVAALLSPVATATGCVAALYPAGGSGCRYVVPTPRLLVTAGPRAAIPACLRGRSMPSRS